MKQFYKQKTFWAGIAALIAGVGGYLTGTMPPNVAWQTTLTALMAIFLRQGINRPGKKKWYAQKTTITGVASLLGTVGGAVTGTLPISMAIQTGVTALTGIFLRQGANK